MSWEAAVRTLIARGREKYPISTAAFVAAIRDQHPHDDLDAPIAALPDECREAAKRIVATALSRDATHQEVREVAVAADRTLAREHAHRMAAYEKMHQIYGCPPGIVNLSA